MRFFMIAIILLSCISLYAEQDFSASGMYAADSLIVTIPGDGEQMTNSRIYFPSMNGQIPSSAVPCPIVVFGHGWQMGVDRYCSYAHHLASWGYVVVLPAYSNPVVVPEHERRSRCLIAAARYMVQQHNTNTSKFYLKLDPANWGFVGHSLGGSLSLMAASLYPSIRDSLRVIVTCSSPATNPDTKEENITQPKMILGGTKDKICPWGDMRASMWFRAQPEGVFAIIAGANHNQFMDYSTYIEDLFDGKADITRAMQLRIARKHMTAYLQRYLKNDRSEWNYLFCYGDSIRHASYMDTVEVREYTGFSKAISSKHIPTKGLKTSPNPFSNYCIISDYCGRVSIFDLSGRLINIVQSPVIVSTKTMKEGVYLFKTESGEIKKALLVR